MFPMFPQFTSNNNYKKYKQNQGINIQADEKSFHIERQTFYQNNFKKIKPTEIFFKQNTPKLNASLSKTFIYPKNIKINDNLQQKSHSLLQTGQKSNKFLQKIMRLKKGIFEDDLNKNLLQVNKSFNRYFCGKVNQEGVFSQQRKKTISCKNILKQFKNMQSSKKFNLPLVNSNQKNFLQLTGQLNYQIYPLQNECLDSLFPYQRYGCALNNYQNQLVIYGGFSSGKRPVLSCFHKYNVQKRLWSKIEEVSGGLNIISCFHTIDIYKNYMILVGGVSIMNDNSKRKFNLDICIFNFDKKQWIKLRSGFCLRSHASTIFGNTLMIHGGLDDKQVNSNQMHFINFNFNSIQNSIILSTQNKSCTSKLKHNLSHHKLVNTNQVQQNIKMLFKYDGVFCFGGIDSDNQMNNQITFLNCIGKQNALDVRFQAWVTVQVLGKGPKPQGRKNHSLNMLNKRGLILLIGGQNSMGQFLSDMWIFDLVKLQWNQINPHSQPLSQVLTDSHYIRNSILQQGISGHSVTFMGTRFYIFGGKKSTQNKKQNCLWSIQTDVINNINKKLKLQKTMNTSTNTIKSSNKQQSMWDIQF